MRTHPLLVASFVAFVAGCSSSSSSGGGGQALSPCQQEMAAYCAAFHRCAPNMFQAELGGDESLCATLEAQNLCDTEVQLPRAADASATHQACAQALATGCTEFFRYGSESSACSPVGTGDVGSPCRSSAQCASGVCAITSSSTGTIPACGSCANPSAVGGPCNDGTHLCGLDSRCEINKCVAFVDEGASCTSAPCHAEDACVGGVCKPRQDVGAPCSKNEECITSFCSAGVCTMMLSVTLVDQGQTCSLNVAGTTASIRYCRPPYHCIGTTSSTGTCGTPLDEGAACTRVLDDPCKGNLTCTNKTCAKAETCP